MLQFTPEEIVKAGEFLGRGILARASLDERLDGVPANEVLSRYSPEQLLEGLKTHFTGLSSEEVLAYLKGIVGEAN